MGLQAYRGGDSCMVGDAEVPQEVPRETELRVVCAHHGQPSLEVQEPSQCHYLITLAVPELCTAKGFEPVQTEPELALGDDEGPVSTGRAGQGGQRRPARIHLAEL